MKTHAHDVYHLILYTHGRNEMVLDGRRCPIRPGTLVLCSPGVQHNIVPQRKGGATYCEVTFSLTAENETALRVSFPKLLSLYAGVPGLAGPEFPVTLSAEQVRELRTLTGRLMDWLTNPSTFPERLVDYFTAALT